MIFTIENLQDSACAVLQILILVSIPDTRSRVASLLTTQIMLTFPNAKINLGLNIIEKRADGFHNIESCFFPIPWSDILEVIPAGKTNFSSSGIAIPESKSGNLCLQAYNLLKVDFDLPPVEIHLHKIIPIGAGLGGGSADGSLYAQNVQ